MDSETIESLIPHRGPMLLVDRVIEVQEKQIHCQKTFAADEFFLQGHFPSFPLVPGVILCECALQSGAILLSRLTPKTDAVPVATRLDNVKFKRMVRPGETIDIQVVLNDVVAPAYFMTGKITVDGKLAARLDFACSVVIHPDPS